MEQADPPPRQSSSSWGKSLTEATRLVAGLAFVVLGRASHRLANGLLEKL